MPGVVDRALRTGACMETREEPNHQLTSREKSPPMPERLTLSQSFADGQHAAWPGDPTGMCERGLGWNWRGYKFACCPHHRYPAQAVAEEIAVAG